MHLTTHLPIVLCCGMRRHCLPTNYDNICCQFHMTISVRGIYVWVSVFFSKLHKHAYSYILWYKGTNKLRGCCCESHSCTKFHMSMFVSKLPKHACSIVLWCVMYTSTLFTNKLLLSQYCCNIAVNAFTWTMCDASLRSVTCCGTRVYCLPTNYGSLVMNIVLLYRVLCMWVFPLVSYEHQLVSSYCPLQKTNFGVESLNITYLYTKLGAWKYSGYWVKWTCMT